MDAIENNDLSAVKTLHESGVEFDLEITNEIAKVGNIEILEYACEKGCIWNESTCQNAAENGHIDVLTYLHENGCPWDEWTCSNAAMNGHFDCVRYANENGCEVGETIMMMCVGADADLDFLKYIFEKYSSEVLDGELSENEMFNAMHRLDYLKYLHKELNCPWDEETCYNFSAYGSVECLKYACENGCPWDKEDCLSVAIENKNDEVIEYINDII